MYLNIKYKYNITKYCFWLLKKEEIVCVLFYYLDYLNDLLKRFSYTNIIHTYCELV